MDAGWLQPYLVTSSSVWASRSCTSPEAKATARACSYTLMPLASPSSLTQCVFFGRGEVGEGWQVGRVRVGVLLCCV